MSKDTIIKRNDVENVEKLYLTGSHCISTNKKQFTNRRWTQRSLYQNMPQEIEIKASQSQYKRRDFNLSNFNKLSQKISELQTILMQDDDVFNSATKLQEKLDKSVLSIQQFKPNWPDKYPQQQRQVIPSSQLPGAETFYLDQKQEITRRTMNEADSPFKQLFKMGKVQIKQTSQYITELNSCLSCRQKDKTIKNIQIELQNLKKQLNWQKSKVDKQLSDSIQRQNQSQNQVDAAGGNFLLNLLNRKMQDSTKIKSDKAINDFVDKIIVDLPQRVIQVQSQEKEMLKKEKQTFQILGPCKIHQNRYVKKICLNVRCKSNRFLCQICQQSHLIHERVEINGPEMQGFLSKIAINALNEKANQNYMYFCQKAQSILKMFKNGLKKIHKYEHQFYSKCTPVLNCIKQSFNTEAAKDAQFIIKNGNLVTKEIQKEKVEYYVGIINQNKTNNLQKYAGNVNSLKQIIQYHEYLFKIGFEEMFTLIDSNFQDSMQKLEQMNVISEEVQDISRSFCCLKSSGDFDQINFRKISLNPNTQLPGFRNGFKLKNGICVYSGIGGVVSQQSLPHEGCYSFTIKAIKLSSNKRIYIGLVSEDYIQNINNIGKANVTYRLETRTIYRFDKQIKVPQADNLINETPMLIDVNVNVNKMKIFWIFNGKIQACCQLPEQWITDKKKFYAEVYLSTENDMIEFM